MGADIYINSISSKLQKKYSKKFYEAVRKRNEATDPKEKEKFQEKVSKYYDAMFSDGYFRDSYNATSLFWVIGLSWWKDIGDMLDEQSNLPVEKCKALLETVKSRTIPSAEELAEGLKKHGASLDDKENSPEAWRKYFVEKKERFEKFLEQAIGLNEAVHCSI